MLNKSMRAKDIWVKTIFGNYYLGVGNQPIEDAVNTWLQGHGDAEVHDILYQHCNYGSGENERIASIAIIYTPKANIKFSQAEPIETLHFPK